MSKRQVFSGLVLSCVMASATNGGFALTANTWLADRSGDDTALIVNGTSCDNFDGVAGAGAQMSGQYCCLEWMKY